MEKKEKTMYNSPAVKVVVFQVESGFANSPLKVGAVELNNGTQQFAQQTGEDSWIVTGNYINQ